METGWTADDEAAVDAAIRDAPRRLRERLLLREAEDAVAASGNIGGASASGGSRLAF
jgi:hypothetical protein